MKSEKIVRRLAMSNRLSLWSMASITGKLVSFIDMGIIIGHKSSASKFCQVRLAVNYNPFWTHHVFIASNVEIVMYARGVARFILSHSKTGDVIHAQSSFYVGVPKKSMLSGVAPYDPVPGWYIRRLTNITRGPRWEFGLEKVSKAVQKEAADLVEEAVIDNIQTAGKRGELW